MNRNTSVENQTPKNISTIIQAENLHGKLSSAPSQFPRRKNLKAFLLRYETESSDQEENNPLSVFM